jgi:hypothetical protein
MGQSAIGNTLGTIKIKQFQHLNFKLSFIED